MNAPFPTRIEPDRQADELDRLAHPYSRTCNCDACFNAWLAMPEPTEAEREAMARAFSAALFPAGRGELVTDWPRFSFPDLDTLTDAEVRELTRGHKVFNSLSQRRPPVDCPPPGAGCEREPGTSSERNG